SSRQVVYRTQDNKLQVKDTDYCIDVVHEAFGDKVELTKCIYTANVYEFTATNEIKFKGKCLSVAHGSPANGAALTLDACVSQDYQRWTVDATSQQVRNQATDLCVTAGYAFAQAVAFKTPSGRSVVVVQNENSEDAGFVLETAQGDVKSVVPKGGIRTFYWDP
ncbi:hypothetical protein As57867_007908, partial [Aphanomyces stellatus]